MQLKRGWEAPGATPEELDLSASAIPAPVWGSVPVNTGWLGEQEPVILEETEDTVLGIDERGQRVKLCKQAATLPLPLEYPVKTMDDWRRLERRTTRSPERFREGWEGGGAGAPRDGVGGVGCGYQAQVKEQRELLGDEALSPWRITSSRSWCTHILDTLGETAFRVLERDPGRCRWTT